MMSVLFSLRAIAAGSLAVLMTGCAGRPTPAESRTPATADPANQDSAKIKSQRYLELSTDCVQTRLSRQFDVAIRFRRYRDTVEQHDSCILHATLLDKQTNTTLDTLAFTSNLLYAFFYNNCDSAISYTTGYHANVATSDNYYGDMVVADFNFDGRDDLALVADMGGNGGPLYRYYLQSSDRRFSLDSFLTDSVSYFPTTIDKRRRRLITYVHASAYSMGEHTYQYNRQAGTWRQIRCRILGA